MLRDSVCSKFFQDAFKQGYILIEATEEKESVLISDGIILIKAPATVTRLKPFTDRSMFPELPEEPGNTYLYSKNRGFQKDHYSPCLQRYIRDELTNLKNYSRLNATHWLFRGQYRLLFNGENHRFISQKLLDLFVNNEPALYSNLNRKKDAPIILSTGELTKENVFAIAMPFVVANLEDENRFPNIPELLR